jgi:predicted RNA-binding Zn-ribbon protein involved in translation (DUF1610 family)
MPYRKQPLDNFNTFVIFTCPRCGRVMRPPAFYGPIWRSRSGKLLYTTNRTFVNWQIQQKDSLFNPEICT